MLQDGAGCKFTTGDFAFNPCHSTCLMMLMDLAQCSLSCYRFFCAQPCWRHCCWCLTAQMSAELQQHLLLRWACLHDYTWARAARGCWARAELRRVLAGTLWTHAWATSPTPSSYQSRSAKRPKKRGINDQHRVCGKLCMSWLCRMNTGTRLFNARSSPPMKQHHLRWPNFRWVFY